MYAQCTMYNVMYTIVNIYCASVYNTWLYINHVHVLILIHRFLAPELRRILNRNIHEGSVNNIKKSDLERCLHVMGFYPTPDDLDFLHSHFDTNGRCARDAISARRCLQCDMCSCIGCQATGVWLLTNCSRTSTSSTRTACREKKSWTPSTSWTWTKTA